MKALALALLALLVVHLMLHRGSPQRSPAAKVAWAGWYDLHPNGGGV